MSILFGSTSGRRYWERAFPTLPGFPLCFSVHGETERRNIISSNILPHVYDFSGADPQKREAALSFCYCGQCFLPILQSGCLPDLLLQHRWNLEIRLHWCCIPVGIEFPPAGQQP